MPDFALFTINTSGTLSGGFRASSGMTFTLNTASTVTVNDGADDDTNKLGEGDYTGHNGDQDQLLTGNTAVGSVTNVAVEIEDSWTVTGSDGSSFRVGVVRDADAENFAGPVYGWVSEEPLQAGVTYTFNTATYASPGNDFLYTSLATICFTAGTLIRTQAGDRPIEDLTTGDMVLTMDNGYQPIRWIGSSKRPATGDLAPILIRKGALDNTRDLRVSPQHRMLLQGWQAELLFGETEVLATAKSLINDHSIIRVEGGEVEYFHMLFDSHEIVWAEGSPSESFHPGEQGWKGLDQATRDEILTLFPQLADGDFTNYGPSARISLKHKEGQMLGEQMIATPQTTH